MDRAQELEQLRMVVDLAGLKPPELVLPEDHELIANGMRFHLLDWGGEGRPPLLFLHGGGLNSHTWDIVCLMLRRQYHCIALDQRGHGDSEWSPSQDYATDTQVRDVEAVVEKLGLKRPVLIGQSMGGLNSIGFALHHSAEMAGLVVIDVGPEVNPAGAARITDFSSTPELDSPDEFLERAVKFNPLRNPAVLRRSLHYNLRQLPNGKWGFKHDMRRRLAGGGGEGDLERLKDLSRQVAAISCPTLIVRGGLSDIVPSDDAAARFAKAFPKARWVRVENAGHNVQGDNPGGLLEALMPFLKEADA